MPMECARSISEQKYYGGNIITANSKQSERRSNAAHGLLRVSCTRYYGAALTKCPDTAPVFPDKIVRRGFLIKTKPAF